ncbi:hypothetical protein RQP46_010233 [Phenoliferia psychrophenolica]
MDFRSMLNPEDGPPSAPPSRMSLSSLLASSDNNPHAPSPPPLENERVADSEEPESPLVASPTSLSFPARPSHSFSHLLSDGPSNDAPPYPLHDPSSAFDTNPTFDLPVLSRPPSVVPDSDASVIVPDSDQEADEDLSLGLVQPKREEWAEDGDSTMRAGSVEMVVAPSGGGGGAGAMDVDEDVDIMGLGDDSAQDAEDEQEPLKLNPLTKQPKRPSKKSSKPRVPKSRSTLSRQPSPTASTSNSPRSHSPSPALSADIPLPYLFNFAPPPLPVQRPEWLSRPYLEYEPPGGNESEEEDEASRAASRRKGKGSRRDKEKEQEVDEEEEKDDRLYCICRQLYDNDRTMIACDKCEEWYHLDCIKIDDDRIDLVDQLICPLCAKLSPARTTWHSPCARPDCLRAVMPLSKYCSDYCGIEVAATRLEISCASSGLPYESFYPSVVGARRREAVVLDSTIPQDLLRDGAIRREEDADESTLRGLQEKLSSIVARRQVLEANRYLIHARLRYLKIAIRRWEALCQATADGLASELGTSHLAHPPKSKDQGKSRAKKGGGGATSLPDAQGLDILDEVCLRPRKKCERHTGWQKVRQADFEVEQAVLTRRLANLDVQERRIRARMEDHEEAARFRLQHRNRVGRALDVEGKMKTPVKATPPKRSRAVGGGAAALAHINAVHHAEKAAAASGEKYEVPDDVFAFLSRGEQAKLKASRR